MFSMLKAPTFIQQCNGYIWRW